MNLPAVPPTYELASVAAVALFMGIEYAWYRLHGENGYDWRETATTAMLGLGQSVTRAASALVIVPVYFFVYQFHLFEIPPFNPLALAAVFVGHEFCYYWFHRFSHAVRWMWATHRVHHSATKFNFSAAYRLGWTNLISAGWLFYLPLMLIGFHPLAVLAVMGLSLAYQFFLHTEIVGKLGALEYVLNTPVHHRVHHSVNESCLDKNYGGALIIFDRLFGTFAEEPAGETLRYGLVDEAPTLNPLKLAFGEWVAMAGDLAAATTPRAAFVALFGKP